MGCHAIILDVISDGGEAELARRKAWYESFDFATFASNPARMFLAMRQVSAAVQASSEYANEFASLASSDVSRHLK